MGEGVVGKAWDGNRANFDRNLAVVIGIDRYKNHPSIRNLSTAASDAKAIATLLQEKYAYQASDMICRFDEQATLDELKTLFDTRIREELNPGEDDRLIIYFAGHGLPRSSDDGPEGYLVPHDADPTEPTSFLAMRDVSEALDKLECHHLLVILDCCFAGTFRWAGSRKAIPVLETIHQEHYYHFIRHPAWQVITSSAHDQEALDVARLKEDNRQPVTDVSGFLFANELHSPFALALLEGLYPGDGSQRVKADLFPDGVVTAHELFVYLQTRVKQLSNKRQAPGIYPLRRDYDKGEFVFTPPEFKPEELAKALPLNEENNPYRGLKSFDEKHAKFFFGRQALIEELAKHLTKPDQALIVVLGVSGSGKSSLVKAGLLPHLRNQKTQQETNLWRILEPMCPGESPFVSLARTLLPIADESLLERLAEVSFLDDIFQPMLKPDVEPNKASVNETLMKVASSWCSAKPEAKLLLIEDYYTQLEVLGNPQQREQLKNLYDQILEKLSSVSKQLQDKPQHFGQLIAAWYQNHLGMRLLLVIDQFEELLTRSQDDRESFNQSDQQGNRPTNQKEWQKFLEALRIGIATHPQTLRLVVTLRSDFEPRFLSSALEHYWKDARFPVRAMTSDELRQAIENPALKQAIYFEELKDGKGNTTGNLVSKLVDEVGQMPGALPLLSFTLSELYVGLYKRWQKDQSTDRTLRFSDYEALGGVAGALTRRATEEYDALDEKHQTTMRRVMLRMVAFEGGGVARRRVSKSELVYSDHGENECVAQVIKRLVEARLLVTGQEARSRTVEKEIVEGYVEPAHDFLVNGWDKLQTWIKGEQEQLVLRQRLNVAANAWIKREGSLWVEEADRLIKLNEIINSNYNWLNRLETIFVRRSSKVRQDRIKKLEEDLRISEQRRARAEIREKSSRDEKLIQDQPLKALVLAIQTIGQNLEELPEEILAPAQWNLLNAIDSSRECNLFKLQKSILESRDILTIAFSSEGHIISGSAISHSLMGEDIEPYGKINIIDRAGNLVKAAFHLKHEDRVRAIAISQDRKTIVSTDRATVHLWDLEGNFEIKIKQRTCDRLNSVAITSDGNKILSVDSGSIGLWNREGKLIAQFNADDTNEELRNFTSGQISSSGELIVCGNRSGFLFFLNNQLQLLFPPFQAHEHEIHTVVISQDEEIIASGGWSTKVKLWNKKGELLGEPLGFVGHHDVVVSISPDSRYIAASSRFENEIHLWDRRILDTKGNPSLKLLKGSGALSLSFAPNSETLVSGNNSGEIRLWDIRSELLAQLPRDFSGLHEQIYISFDGQYILQLVNGGQMGWVGEQLWNHQGKLVGQAFRGSNYWLRNGEEFCQAESPATFIDDSFLSWCELNSITKGLQGQHILVGDIFWTWWLSYFHQNPIDDFLVGDRKDLYYEDRNQRQPFWKGRNTLNLMSVSLDRETLVSATPAGEIQIWDLQLNTINQFLAQHDKDVTSIAISHDGQIIATSSLDRTVKLWDRQGKVISQPLRHTDSVLSVTFTLNRKTIITHCQSDIDQDVVAQNYFMLWNCEGNYLGQFLRLHLDGNQTLAISPDCSYIVTYSGDNSVQENGELRLWRVGSLMDWLKVACNRLTNHPILRNPKSDEALAACKICEKFVWNKVDS